LKKQVLDLATNVWRRLPSRARRTVVHSLSDRFPVGVVGLIDDGRGNVLLLEHRFRTPYPWGLPGGFMEYGESFEDALRRELSEEIDLQLEHVEPEPFDTELNLGGRYLSITLLARAVPKPLVLSGEITGGAFFAPGTLPAETYPHQASVVERFWKQPTVRLHPLPNPT
jgi:ADP-ribose pyrophosphatase YjhB (NUDIX family)